MAIQPTEDLAVRLDEDPGQERDVVVRGDIARWAPANLETATSQDFFANTGQPTSTFSAMT
jgi:hypothetical protein